MFLLEVLAYVLMVLHVGGGMLQAVIFGVALVGVTDLVAVLLTLFIGAARGYPLSHPSRPPS